LQREILYFINPKQLTMAKFRVIPALPCHPRAGGANDRKHCTQLPIYDIFSANKFFFFNKTSYLK